MEFAFLHPDGKFSGNLLFSFFETLQYYDEWRKFTSVSQ